MLRPPGSGAQISVSRPAATRLAISVASTAPMPTGVGDLAAGPGHQIGDQDRGHGQARQVDRRSLLRRRRLLWVGHGRSFPVRRLS